MRSDFVDAGEQPVKMIPRKAGFPGKPVQTDGSPEIVVDIDFSRDDFLIYFRGDGHTED
jgi:hypothetical protein